MYRKNVSLIFHLLGVLLPETSMSFILHQLEAFRVYDLPDGVYRILNVPSSGRANFDPIQFFRILMVVIADGLKPATRLPLTVTK